MEQAIVIAAAILLVVGLDDPCAGSGRLDWQLYVRAALAASHALGDALHQLSQRPLSADVQLVQHTPRSDLLGGADTAGLVTSLSKVVHAEEAGILVAAGRGQTEIDYVWRDHPIIS